jgi:hypothetical protein
MVREWMYFSDDKGGAERIQSAMDRSSRYRKHAQDCRDLAERAGSDEERRLLHELARHWSAIADLHEEMGRRRERGR